jgi:hypothetical protein
MAHPPPAGLLVCHVHDYVVSKFQWLGLRVVLTCMVSIVIPWLCIREVPVDVELVRSFVPVVKVRYLNDKKQPSPKVAILRFGRGMQQGLLGRISRSAVVEYHAFGVIR